MKLKDLKIGDEIYLKGYGIAKIIEKHKFGVVVEIQGKLILLKNQTVLEIPIFID